LEEIMTRTQKQNKIAAQARNLASALERGVIRPFFGNEGVCVYRDGTPGDIVGTVLQQAGLVPRVVTDETDPKTVLALALGTTIYALPLNLQIATNELAVAADDTKRSYKRRVPKLVKLLNHFARNLDLDTVPSAQAVAVPPPVTGGFKLPGKIL
jgi:hypothetical protein